MLKKLTSDLTYWYQYKSFLFKTDPGYLKLENMGIGDYFVFVYEYNNLIISHIDRNAFRPILRFSPSIVRRVFPCRGPKWGLIVDVTGIYIWK